ncbi:tRNA (adenine-N(1)-)-methyltransferase non-catalytic subunit [Taphrina deformans PYCC 5710]|uniref:tRNA (adenine(58)-N(1))-methyltransferase non-catalytic subunit TRM6 n=1 Tax=Taphrina deformans (strain PYCC 5710 / ATCC 11124 / CBS 356.35 / IMI 108563 / JCM 9778 / NBRC 8474) TaxID=1097556 RepID=R4X6A9_TAPDE|nr:tRNA (adenine-N(1)-)-methyltransferase non-catalytic subunit [Taphrina deformans PYCC 5710]|eukprot:CCG80530.1 tRNA (adenine-N(1)-)-methyltransferase non-catalytic subunit [Taphrina deformans PYCC 5710]
MLPSIAENHSIIIRLPSGAYKLITVRPDSSNCSLGKFGTFDANHLLGHPYGYTYEIQSDKSLRILTAETLKRIEEEVGNNEFIVDDNEMNQVMSHQEIRALRDAGDRDALIEKLKQNNKSFDLKTEYSKEKYTARKMAKFAPRFTTIPPTLFDVISFLTDKDPEKIMNVNQESMAFMLSAADVRPGGHYLVVDDVSGLLVAGLLELGANVTMIHDTEHANIDSVKYFPQFNSERLFAEGRLKALNWEQAIHRDTVLEDLDEYINDKKESTHIKDIEKVEKREAMKRAVIEFHDTTFDGLLVMSSYTPIGVLKPLLPRLGTSRKVVLYSPYREPLLALRHEPLPELLMPSIKELRAREYQVLQGRTRPVMTKRGEWGYVYHAIKVERLDGVIAIGKNQVAREKNNAAAKKKATAATAQSTTASTKPLLIEGESMDDVEMKASSQGESSSNDLVEEAGAGEGRGGGDEHQAKKVKLSEA